jgi:signal transduction histidine kinase
MTWQVFNVAMRPIKQIDQSIKTLDLKTFDIKTALVAPYKEFLNIVDSFEKLRLKLIQSFDKARRFASDASHELRTPLTILRGNAEVIIKDLPVGSDEQIRMQMVINEIDRLVTITQKLLWLSRADANKLQPVYQEVNLSDVMGQWVLDAQTFNPKLKLTSNIQPKVIWKCDADLIHQLIGNLYDNAVKYNVAMVGSISDYNKMPVGFIYQLKTHPLHYQLISKQRLLIGFTERMTRVPALLMA